MNEKKYASKIFREYIQFGNDRKEIGVERAVCVEK